MRTECYFDSCGEGRIHVCRWAPEGEVKAVVQILHGIAEYAQRYEEFALHLNTLGILVVADDHMGHGKSKDTGTKGYFAGGWLAAVDDSYQLLRATAEEFPNVPYILFGHSMGSFMARTILTRYPDSGIAAAVICGTGWMPNAVITAGIGMSSLIGKLTDERKPSELLQGVVFGSYNQKVEHPKTPYDWLSRDEQTVAAYIADPDCGFTASTGLLRDMMKGIQMIQDPKSLQNMEKKLPVLFIAGGDDPVGNYGAGVTQAAEAFQKYGMEDVQVKLFPMCRHEILNEINRAEVYSFVSSWICAKVDECGEKAVKQ